MGDRDGNIRLHRRVEKAMNYLCSHCSTEFSTEDKTPRCPVCLRKHGLLPADQASAKAESAKKDKDVPPEKTKASSEGSFFRKWLWLLAAGVCVVVVGAGVLIWYKTRSKPSKSSLPPRPGLGRASPEVLIKHLAHNGLGSFPLPFEPDDRIKGWVKGIEGKDLAARARALLGKLNRLKAPDGPLVVVKPSELKPKGPLTASGLLALVQAGSDKKEKIHALSYELACLFLAAARAAGMKAVLAELHKIKGLSGPADPSGRSGRFGVALFEKSELQKKPDIVVDPVAHELDTATEYDLLDDLTAVAYSLNLKSHSLMGSNNPDAAALFIRAARELGRASATIQCGAGTALLALGGIDMALSSLHAAVAIRDDAPRHLCLAIGYLATRQVSKALSELSSATRLDPGYAEAYVEHARLLVDLGQPDKAEELLDRAEQARKGLRSVKVLKAVLMAVRGSIESAVERLDALVQAKPDDPAAFFYLWQILMRSDQQEKARALEESVLKRLSGTKREVMAASIAQARKMWKKMLQAQAQAGKGDDPSGVTGKDPQQGTPPTPSVPLDPNAPAPDLDFKLKTPGIGPGSMKPDSKLKLNY